MEHEQHHNVKAGIGHILVAWFFFTVMTIVTRYAGASGTPISVILLFTNLIGLISLSPWVYKHGWDLVRTDKSGLLLFRSLVSITAVAFSFLAVQNTSLVNTMLFQNASPLWIPFVVLLWRKIRINHKLWPGLIGGFIGIILILQPGKEVIQLGSFFAIIAGFLQSFNMVAIRVLSYTTRNHTVMFYYFLICSILCLPFAIFQWKPLSAAAWGETILVGVLFTLGQWAFVRAFHHAKASYLGPFCYSAVVFAILIDWGLYGQVPNIMSWLGIALVCTGGIWAIRYNQPVAKH